MQRNRKPSGKLRVVRPFGPLCIYNSPTLSFIVPSKPNTGCHQGAIIALASPPEDWGPSWAAGPRCFGLWSARIYAAQAEAMAAVACSAMAVSAALAASPIHFVCGCCCNGRFRRWTFASPKSLIVWVCVLDNSLWVIALGDVLKAISKEVARTFETVPRYLPLGYI